MNVLKKIAGIFLIVLSVLGIITFGLIILNGIFSYYYFHDLMPFKMIVFLFICLLCFCILFALGIFLLKKKNGYSKKVSRRKDKNDYGETRISNSSKYSENILGKFTYFKDFSIWKYSEDSSSLYKRYRILYVALIVFVSFVIIIVSSILLINSEYKKWLSLLLVIIVTLGLTVGARIIGIKSKSMLITFAYDRINKRLYMFDYDFLSFRYNPNASRKGSANPAGAIFYYLKDSLQTGKTIDYINDNKVIEKIIESGKMFPYSEELVKVEKLKVNSYRCTFKGEFKMGEEEGLNRTITIPTSYENFEELLNILKQMNMYN